jgi:hypothetical protein
MAANRPDVWFGLAMNRDANDPYTSPVWADWTTGLRKVSGLERGQNFELDQPLAAEPSLLIRDVNEYLNPANPSSPYADLLQPYREACLLAQWPNTPVGGAVNLFNTGTWKGNKEDARDGSFESFATGVRPSWLTAIGATTPLVSTLFPFQGTKSIRYGIGSGATIQGVSWPVACIPGRQYTTSVYVLQDAASTQRISVTDLTAVGDPFAGRTVTNGLGTSFSGAAWTTAGGAAGDYAAGGGSGRIANNTANVNREASISAGNPNQSVYVRFSLPVVPSGAPIVIWVGGRRTDFNNQYMVQLSFNTDTTVTATLLKRVAGVQSTATGTTTSANLSNHTPGAIWNVRFDLTDIGQIGLIWRDGQPPPISSATLVGTDTSLSTGNTCAFMSLRSVGNTDAVTTSISAFYVTAHTFGTTTSTTGSYQRLSVTWTATQPIHTVRLATSGTAVAATVNVDAIQHEQGASASAYTTSGPVIYPVFRNLVEQYPRIWGSAGFEGFVAAPCVDAFAALQAITIKPEYPQAVDDQAPDFYWRLNDGAQALLFADSSGYAAPALAPGTGKSGAGPGIEPGTQITIAGDPGAVGVAFDSNLTSTPPGNTVLGTGPSAGQQTRSPQPITVPPTAGIPWALTGMCWVQLSPAATTQIPLTFQRFGGSGVQYRPLQLRVGPTSIDLQLCTGTVFTTVSYVHAVADGLIHHLAGVVIQDATNTTLNLYVDGVLAATTTVVNATAGGILPLSADSVYVGGSFNVGEAIGVCTGVVTEVSAWTRALSTLDIGTLYTIGLFGFNGETAGGRILRRLTGSGLPGAGRYSGPTRISQNAGSALETNLQPPTWTDRKDLLSDSLETTGAELGGFWVAPDGAVVFESRQDRWLRLSPSFVLGEDTASGEIPYVMDGTKFSLDPLYVYADVQIGRNNGATAQGGTVADIAAAGRRYFPRSVSGSFDFYTDDTAQSMANWIFNTHDQPVLRVDELTVDPASDPVLWPFVLGAEIGQRGTVKRRAKAANAGAGITMSADYFIEKIGVDAIDFDSGEWKYRIELSPINAAPPPGQPTFQPWILGDATYGVLAQTTVLGW